MNVTGNVAMMSAVGGAVGPASVMNQDMMRHQGDEDQKIRLNTYIYDYLLKLEEYELARSFSTVCPIKSKNNTSPGRGTVNGVDDAMESDSKDASIKKKHDLPIPDVPSYSENGNCFLYDWWCQFWDVYGARTRVGQTRATETTLQYLGHNLVRNFSNIPIPPTQLTNLAQGQSKSRQQWQRQMLQPNDPNMMRLQGQFGGNTMMQSNGMMTAEMAKRMQNNRNGYALLPIHRATIGANVAGVTAWDTLTLLSRTPQQIQQQMAQAAKMGQNPMQRDGSNMEMGGQRPNTPGSMENAPSPSKRPRLDGGTAFGGQPIGPAGRGQPMSGPQMNNLNAPAGPNGSMLLQNGVTDLQQQHMGFAAQAANLQQKQIEVCQAQLANIQRAHMNNHAKAMNANLSQTNQMAEQVMDRMNFNMGGQRMAGAGAGQTTGHALEDYQMQLMLLEQQNKKRLLMARQEQDHSAQLHPGSTPNAHFTVAPTMSPSQSRAGGPSPNPNDQLKRVAGTPKIGQGMPGSPMTDIQNRVSPTPVFDATQMPQGSMPSQAYVQMMNRPPSSHPVGPFLVANMNHQQQLEVMRRAPPNGQPFPQGGPQMMPQNMQNPQQQPPQIGTPQQRQTTMPPPRAPASQEQQRTQPSSPSQQSQQAPPTPSQAPKSTPKVKKEGKGPGSKVRIETSFWPFPHAYKKEQKNPAKKQGTTGATPAAENAEPPTPQTPITPMHRDSFNKQQNGNNAPNQQQQQPPNANANQPQAGPGQQSQSAAAAAQAPPVAQSAPTMEFDAGANSNFALDFGDAVSSWSEIAVTTTMLIDILFYF